MTYIILIQKLESETYDLYNNALTNNAHTCIEVRNLSLI